MLQETTSILPAVSFCISTYKRTDYLQKQLEAVRNQTVADWEVIVSDNDAENHSAKAVVELFNDSRIVYLSNTDNLGMVKSFNRSLSHAKGRFVVMLTDDDPVYPGMLETLLDLEQHHPGYGMYMGSHDTYYEKLWLSKLANRSPGIHSGLANLEIGAVRSFSADQFLQEFCTADFGGGILWSTGMVKRELALNIGGVPDYGTPFLSDAAYLILAGSKQGAVFINKAVGCQTIHGSNYSYANSNYSYIEIAPIAFHEFIVRELNIQQDAAKQEVLNKYIGQTLTTYFVFLKRVLELSNTSNDSFSNSIQKIYSWPIMSKWHMKYKIGIKYPELFKLAVQLKKVILPK
jgi:glycosyltransferase involved in cell wall biosynthesis